jgi:transposase
MWPMRPGSPSWTVHGLVRPSFEVAPPAGINLSSVATDSIGVSGRAMLEALVAGTHDPAVLAALAKGRLRAKLPALREALAGRFRTDHHGLGVAQILAHVDYLDEAIATLLRGSSR